MDCIRPTSRRPTTTTQPGILLASIAVVVANWGSSGYDVVFPSARPFGERQIKAGLYEALDRAHAVATIPTTEHFSLNVAQACLLALYELHLLCQKLHLTRHLN